jgi:hypothetical protein
MRKRLVTQRARRHLCIGRPDSHSVCRICRACVAGAIDAALVAGLYRKLRHDESRHWLTSAIRHTWVPALVAGLFLIVAGVAIQWALPDARSIGDVWRQIR